MKYKLQSPLKYIMLLITVLSIVGCSTLPQSNVDTIIMSNSDVDMDNEAQVRDRLLLQLNEWNGVPYRIGGMSKQGVDCSGFIYLTFAEEFNVTLPRTTEKQIEKGIVIEQHELSPGDLVFFKTGFKQRHVGIYVGDNQFIHTSSSKGVMMSRLENPYWKRVFWHARRIVM